MAGGKRIGRMGAGRCESCLLLDIAGRIGWTGVAKAGEDDGMGWDGSLKGVFATGRCGSAAIVNCDVGAVISDVFQVVVNSPYAFCQASGVFAT